MAVTLIGTGGLFTILGKMGKLAHDVQSFQATTLLTDVNAVPTAFNGTLFEDVIGSFSAQRFSVVTAAGGQAGILQSTAATLVNRMINADTALTSATDIYLSLVELIRQMKVSADSVNDCVVSASAAAISVPTVTGNGAIVLSTKRGDGLVEQNLFAEVAPLKCVRDNQLGGTSGSEGFLFTGDQLQSDVWAYDWPQGSGGTTQITAVDGSLNNGPSRLYNGGFDLFGTTTANTPDGWIKVAGTAGTDFKQNTSTYYDDEASSLEFVGGGTAPNLTQLFNAASSVTGTTRNVVPLTQYALNFWVKASVVPAAGVLTVDLIDGSNTVIADDQGTNNTFAVTLSGISTSFVAKNTTFRLPRVLPSSIKIRIRASTGISAGTSIYIDRMSLAPMTALYVGGPQVAIFSGSTAFVIPDGWLITCANDRGGSTYGTAFQCFFDRMFGMRQMGLLLPYATGGGETISDSLLG